MGKTKWVDDDMALPPRQSRTTGARNKNSKPVFRPSDTQRRPTRHLPWWQRLHRNWLAFRFQVHRYTLGLFEKQALPKLGVLAACIYVFFLRPSDATSMAESDPQLPVTETSMDVVGDLTEYDKKPAKKAPAQPKSKPSKEKNLAAPVAAKDLGSGSAEAYIRRYSNIARIEMEKFGIPASISLAQGLVESRAGTSTLARKNNNHFGIKCFARNCPGGHCSNHNDDHHKDFFRIFGNPWESWRAHSRMISSGRYARLKQYGRDYKKWAYGLKSVGYATDSNYAEKLIGIIERYELYKYDR